MAKYFAILMLLALIFAFGCTSVPKACTEEAKLCPDGSAVGRNGSNNCEFDPCPVLACSNHSSENCPSACVVCPPCEACSSISCQTEQFCASIGFNRSWWESVSPTTMTKEKCESARGHWNECGSACRNTPEGTVCTMHCVAYCECGGIAGFGCPSGTACTDYLPKGAADAMGICRPGP